MNNLNMNDVIAFVEERIPVFHERRLSSLEKLNLKVMLKRKNPYLFKAKNVLIAQDFVKAILDPHLSSQEETIFGEFLEELAIFVAGKVHQGHKSSAEGIDLEMILDDVYYIVSVKSGPNWGNSNQIARMKSNFTQAARRLRQNAAVNPVRALNGCCYGIDDKPDKGEYLKLCGQRFWEFISGSGQLYVEIIEPLGHQAKKRNDDFQKAYTRLLNKFTFEFMKDFCADGEINRENLLVFNSGKKR